jgi:hypothetical protein
MTLLPVFHRSFLRFLRSLLFLLLLLHVLFHRVPRLGLRGIGLGTGNGRDEKRLTEKDKQDTSWNFLHKLSHEAGFCGISQRESPGTNNLSRRSKGDRPASNAFLTVISAVTHRIRVKVRAGVMRQRLKEFGELGELYTRRTDSQHVSREK